MDPGFDRSQGALHRFRDFGVRQLRFVKQDKRLPIFGADLLQGTPDLFRKTISLGVIRPVVCHFRNQGCRCRAPHPRGQQASAPISRNGEQPGLHIPLGVPPVEVPQGSHKGLLGHVFGILALPKHARTQTEYAAFVAVHKLGHGHLVPRKAAAYQAANLVRQCYPRLVLANEATKKYPGVPKPVSAIIRAHLAESTPFGRFIRLSARDPAVGWRRSRPERELLAVRSFSWAATVRTASYAVGIFLCPAAGVESN
jgi:hypothetical protein